tara:strand:+ start:232 stop:681 length:450 start_codon:yes stop_codon:yes gene_type:complete
MNKASNEMMDKLQMACSNEEIKSSMPKSINKNFFKGFLFDIIFSNEASSIRIFKFILIGFIHAKKQNSIGFLIGIHKIQIQLTISKTCIFNIKLFNIFSLGLIQSDNKEAIGTILNIMNISIQSMIGYKKSIKNTNQQNAKVSCVHPEA